ncbi:hypothetical protein QQS21_005321 [Conoideocrella luteorostrata]|uniref:Heterokaryon incompatibility domain-containing protein n=1 Tax=Conoideocrella luteorostrata TaxID=1105319 RepID=A0AAJ0CPY0_9HYPO|nr:hypothetical protein QQS21_005321 [Conoideocrella luteorostrata]
MLENKRGKNNSDYPILLSLAQKTSQRCDLCRLLANRFEGWGDETEIHLLNSRSRLRICAAPGTGEARKDIQIGFPALPRAGSPAHFDLLREWLRVCDEDHKPLRCRLKSKPENLPTRVLDVGDGEDFHFLRLCEPKPGQGIEYIALSHSWGKLSPEQKSTFCTNAANVGARHVGFDIDKLPQAFKDAIHVTRRLQKRYLWIDSLCIVQDDESDWELESRRMEAVFDNAYCTIAATSAKDCTVGFLNTQPTKQQCIKVPTSSHGQVFICETTDDFDRDVEDGILNKRAWVLQERALSCRTIHFTDSQTYWECGVGVRCESLTHMRNSKALFLGDPDFPESVRWRRYEDQVSLFQFLCSRYSALGLSVRTDRAVAISGLQERVAGVFASVARYGVFEKYLHRSLLWQRSARAELEPISYQNNSVPSWSWMAYHGKIEYMHIPFGDVEWVQDIRFMERTLTAEVQIFYNWDWLAFNPNGGAVRKMGSCTSIQLIYDEEQSADSEDRGPVLYFVALGREPEPDQFTFGFDPRCYGLIVTPRQDLPDTYKRIGVGYFPKSRLHIQGQGCIT